MALPPQPPTHAGPGATAPMADAATPPASPSPPASPRVALLALAAWLLATLGLRPLAVPDEGRYAEVARQMWITGDWLVPRLNGLPFFHKPPLMYWIDAAGFAFFGPTVSAARLAPALGAWAMGAVLLYALRRWQSPRAAQTALWVLATSPLFFLSAQYANHDMLVAGAISACVVALARAADPGQRSLRWLVVAWACAGLAVLAKGLIGIVLPTLVVLPWLAWQRRWRDIGWCAHPLGLAAFAAVALPWCIAVQWRYPGFYDYFIVEQHFRRYAQAGFNNSHGIWYYLVLLPLATLPWSAWGAAGAWRAWVVRGTDRLRGLPRWWRDRPWPPLCAWWLIVIVGFFSLPRSKLIGYVLPALVPWSWWLAREVDRAPRRAARCALAAAVLLDLGTVAALHWRPVRSTADIAQVLADHIAPADRVTFVDDMFYDLPFAAHLRSLPRVASDWADPGLPLHDNWRKELADAARFDPAAARGVLLPIDRLGDIACGSTTWYVVRPRNVAQLSRRVPDAALAATGADALLFRRAGLPCR